MVSWNFLIILKEIKERSGKYLSVWAQHLWRLKILNLYIYKFQWKIDFLSIFYPTLQELCGFIQLPKITILYKFSVSAGSPEVIF